MDTQAQLQIVISLINNAADQLTEVGDQLSALGTQANEAATQMSGSLTTAEEAFADAAVAAASQWDETSTNIVDAVSETATGAEGGFAAISDAALTAANNASEGWQSSLAELRDQMSMTSAQVDAELSGIGSTSESAAGTVGSSMTSMHGYFRMLLVGYMAERAGQGLLGAVGDTITAAMAGAQTDKIAQLTDQINQQKAAIAEHQAELLRWNGTTAQVAAAHEAARADIEAETTKIDLLQKQLAPLEAQQKASAQTAQEYAQATAQLNIDWQEFLATVGTTLLPSMTRTAEAIDEVVQKLTAWAEAHPKLTETILVFLSILGTLLVVLGSVFIAVAPLIIVFGMLGIAFTASAAVIAVGIAAVIAGIIFLVAAVVTNWTAIVSFIQDHWQAILQILVPGIGSLVVLLANNWSTIKTDVESAWNWIANFIEGIWNKIVSTAQTALTTVQNLINKIMAPITTVTNAVSGITGGIGNVVGASIKAFAEGGIVSSPTLALVGEAGPEAIIPLSAFAGGSSLAGAGGGFGGGGINVYIQGGTYLDQGGATIIANALATQIGRQIKLRNFF